MICSAMHRGKAEGKESIRQVTKARRLCSSSTQTRKSFTTTWVVGASPSDPPPYRNPSKEPANALAAAQPCPPQSPRLFDPSPQDYGLTPRSGFCQKARVGQLGVGSLLPTPGRPRLLHPRGRPGDAQNVTMQSRHEGGVHRQLGASEQKQPVCQDLDSSSVLGIWSCQVKISEHGIRDHSAACLPADASPGALHCEPPPPPESCPRARSSVVAQKCREDGHTDTDVRREGGRGEDGAEGGLGTMATRSE